MKKKNLDENIRKINLGDFFRYKNELGLKINGGFIVIHELQLQDRKKMNSKEFLNGYPLETFSLVKD